MKKRHETIIYHWKEKLNYFKMADINEIGLIFVVAYQESFNVLYTDKLLELDMKDFINKQLPSLNHK